jgi:hypothetical protein
MALTLTEIAVWPAGEKRMAIWKITGDGTNYQVKIADIKMSKVEAAWTENISASVKPRVYTGTYDYVDSFVETIEVGGNGDDYDLPIDNAAEVLLFVVGY